MVDLNQGVKDDLNGGGKDRESGMEELNRLHSESESSLPKWAEYGIYAALIIAIIQIYVGFEVPDGTLLVGTALGFLALGLWAGMRMHEELGELADRFNDWRQE